MTKTWGSAADVEAVLPQTLVVYDMGAINHADARWQCTKRTCSGR